MQPVGWLPATVGSVFVCCFCTISFVKFVLLSFFNSHFVVFMRWQEDIYLQGSFWFHVFVGGLLVAELGGKHYYEYSIVLYTATTNLLLAITAIHTPSPAKCKPLLQERPEIYRVWRGAAAGPLFLLPLNFGLHCSQETNVTLIIADDLPDCTV